MNVAYFIRIVIVFTLSGFIYGVHLEADQTSRKAGEKEIAVNLQLKEEIEEELRRTPSIRSQSVFATVETGIVTLSGSVDSLSDSRAAAEITATRPGVRAVVNQIVVQPPVVDDDEIVEYAVELVSETEAADASRIQITAKDGIIELKGRADSLMESNLIESQISFIRGVKAIDNKLEINSRRDTNDDELQAIITKLMQNSAVLDSSNIEVTVNDRRVSLSGTVLKPSEKSEAVHLAGIPGVVTVSAENLAVGSDDQLEKRRAERIATTTDGTIVEHIQLAMRQHPLLIGSADKIKVESSGGVVTLTGEAKRFSSKKAAEHIARYVIGVQGVDNRIEVGWPEGDLSDVDIVENVATAIQRDAYLDKADIIPRSRDFHVHLYGMVETRFEKERAGFIAEAQPGVVHVANYLTVSSDFEAKSDDAIAGEIRRKLELMATDPQFKVSVDVLNGVPVFRGRVATWFQWQGLIRIADEAGARRPHLDVAVLYKPNGIGGDLYVPQ